MMTPEQKLWTLICVAEGMRITYPRPRFTGDHEERKAEIAFANRVEKMIKELLK